MSTRRQRLFDLEFDEVSSVDRPANQYGKIQIAKALTDEEIYLSEDDTLELVDGGEIEVSELAYGDEVVDEAGQTYVYLPADEAEREEFLAGDAEDQGDEGGDEPEDVGKTLGQVAEQTVAGAKRAASWAGKNKGKTAAAAGAAGVAGGGAYMEAKKSLGTTVLEALSKAVSDQDRDQVVSKLADDLEATQNENAEIRKALEEERDLRITEAFIAKAAEYELPVEPAVFGPILKSIAEVLTDDELTVLDEVLMSKGADIFDERGFTGGASNSGVLDELYGVSAELVGKAAGSVSLEQATVALLENNPAMYDAYLAEQNGR